LTSLSVDKLMS